MHLKWFLDIWTLRLKVLNWLIKSLIAMTPNVVWNWINYGRRHLECTSVKYPATPPISIWSVVRPIWVWRVSLFETFTSFKSCDYFILSFLYLFCTFFVSNWNAFNSSFIHCNSFLSNSSIYSLSRKRVEKIIPFAMLVTFFRNLNLYSVDSIHHRFN